jgi:tRNA(fMet)-specific endonuclease VapC
MIYALDSNIISYLLRPTHNPEVVQKFEEWLAQGGDYIVPPICHYEVSWLLISKNATTQMRNFDEIYNDSLSSLHIGEAEIKKAAEIRADLQKRGKPVGDEKDGDADVLIAAHCIVNDYTLVTNNEKDFRRIEGLKFVNWKQQ